RFAKESPPVPWCWSLRAIRGVLGVAWVAGAAALGFLLFASNRRSLMARAEWLQRTCRRCLRVLHVEVVVEGGLPRGALLAPNHISYLDIIVLSATTPTVFVSKSEVKGWPMFGWFAQRAG